MMTQHKRNKGWIGMMVALAWVGMVTSARGGSLDSPAAPTDPASAMYTLQDVYNRLDTGAAGAKRTGAFAEPTADPTAGTMSTTDDIMAKAPAMNASGAVAGEVLSGKTFWGLTPGAWGTRTGTIATVTLSPTTTNVNAGYYAATNLAQVDTDLATANIKAGISLFGVTGTPAVVDTTSGDAVAGDMLASKKAWVDGVEVTGSIETRTLSPTTTNVAAGYYAATNLAQVDPDLAAGNIATNVTIFGMAGSACPAPVPKTGQTNTCRVGDDGTNQIGVAWPNPRFTVGANTNVVTDNLTGLIWARNANLASNITLGGWSSVTGTCTWEQAFDVITNSAGPVNGANYGGTNDWRLPNMRELESLVDYGGYNPALCNTAGTGQWVENDPFTGVQSLIYWSSTSSAQNPSFKWVMMLDHGRTCHTAWSGAPYTYYVWPVRGGQ